MSGGPLVDFHVHLYPDETAARRAKETYEIWEYGADPGVVFDAGLGTRQEVTDRYGRAGFDAVVLLQLFDLPSERAAHLARLEPGLPEDLRAEATRQLDESLVGAYTEANRWAVETAAGEPLLVAFAGVHPGLLPPAVMADHIAALAKAGARGVKLHPTFNGHRPDDPRLDAIYQLCCDLGLVVLSHSGSGSGGEGSARPGEFAPVLQRWPGLRLVLAHLGGSAYPEAEALAAEFPNVSFDLSEIIEWAGAPNAPSRAELARIVRAIGADRILLGSDFPWYDPVRTAAKVSDLPGLGGAERTAILGGTAMRLLGA